MKITKERGKTILIGAITILLLVAIFYMLSKYEEPTPTGVESYEIRSGETLWSIASTYRPESMSIQEYIYYLEQENGINAEIFAGQTIKILIFD